MFGFLMKAPSKQYCDQGDNMVEDVCVKSKEFFDSVRATDICSNPSTFSNPNCQKFCAGEIIANTTNSAACHRSAGTFCLQKENFYDPRCACINYDKTADYTDNINTFGEGLKKTNYQCWTAPCSTSGDWMELLRSTVVSTCPQQLQVCNQIMNLSDIKAQSLGDIKQSCNADMGKTTADGPAAGGPAAAGAPAAAGSTTAPPDAKGAAKSNTSTYAILCTVFLVLAVLVLCPLMAVGVYFAVS